MTNGKMTRGEFLRDGFKTILDFTRETVASQVEKTVDQTVIKIVRPPGAMEEINFLVMCSRCDKCTIACPHDAIKPCGTEYGAAVGTPMMIPDVHACEMCSDMPCIASCEDKALRPNEDGNWYKIGDAHVIKNKCFAYQGQICDYCFDRCPEKGIAITMEDGKPNVIQDKCTGCGQCQYYCPAPGNGITILPLGSL